MTWRVAPTTRVLIIDGYFHWPPGGGGIRDIAEIANGLSENHEVVLLTPRYGFRGWLGYQKGLKFEVRTVPFDKVTFNGPVVLRRLRSAVRSLNPDIVIVGNGNTMKPFLILACRGYRTFVRLYSYELLCPISHGLLFNSNNVCETNYFHDPTRCVACMARHPQRSAYDREILRGPAVCYPTYLRALRKSLTVPEAFIVTSRYMRRRYSEVIDSGNMVMIPSGLDCSKFAPRESRSDEIVRILSAGRVDDPSKGLGTLLEAAEILWERRKDFRLYMAGRSPPEQTARPFVGYAGWVSERELPSAYIESDIVVVPSLWAEPFGMVALEGMGCGKAIVASDIGGLTDFVEHEKSGYLFTPGRADKLSQALETLIESPAKRKRFGRAARKRALSYDWSQIVPLYENLLTP